MKRSILIAISFLCLLLVFVGCEKTEDNTSYTMDRFENTDWGMTPQEVLEVRSLSFENMRIVDLYEGANTSGYQTYSIISENEEILGLPATVTYYFTDNYIPVAKKGIAIYRPKFCHRGFS